MEWLAAITRMLALVAAGGSSGGRHVMCVCVNASVCMIAHMNIFHVHVI